MEVVPIPCLRDNYAYLIICRTTAATAVVDPSEAGPVLARLKELGLQLNAILNTHHHWDHVGGNRELIAQFPDIEVYGHASDKGRIPGQTVFLDGEDRIPLGNLEGSFSHNPGHTTGAVTYYFKDAGFTGDTLFAAGCGRLFEGTPQDMYASLHQAIGARPPETKLYFGHEYTENNLRFALSVEPDNRAVQEKLTQVLAMRAKGEFTTPTTLAEEWQTNPFMRCDSAAIQTAAMAENKQSAQSPAGVLGAIRQLKDRF